MHRLLVLFTLLLPACLLCGASSLAAEDPPHHALVRFHIESEQDQDYIDQNHGRLDIATGRRGAYYDLVVPQHEVAATLAAGTRTEVIHEDLEGFYAGRLGRPDNFGVWHTYSETIEWMDQLAADYPEVISARWSIGQSHEGNDLWCFRLSDNPGVDEDGEPEVLFDGLHHAREIMASEMGMMLAEYLAQEYAGGNQEIIDLVDANELYIIPIVNPDGFLYNELTDPGGGGMWRKNRRDNGDGTYGVDPNRNYPYEWGCDWGSSGYTWDETYRGPYAGSEPEVQAMMQFINEHDFIVRQSWHTYGELTLYPWGYTTEDTPDEAIFREMGGAMTQYNGYAPGQPGDVLYDVCGGNFDWDYGAQDEHTKIFSFSNEIGNSGDGFWPAESRRDALFEDNLWPALYMIQVAAGLRSVSFAHDPVPFQANPSASHEVVAAVFGYEGAEVDPASVTLFYRIDGGAFVEMPMDPTGQPDEYAAAIPAQPEGTVVEYYLFAEDVEQHQGTSPRTAPDALHYFEIGHEFEHAMEADRGWRAGAADDDASTGLWVRVDPVGTEAQPEDDHTTDGTDCWVTGQHLAGQGIGYNDVDSGKTTLYSPVYDLTGATEVSFGYWRWYCNDAGSSPGTDYWDVDLSADGGETWTSLEHTQTTNTSWLNLSFNLFDYVAEADRVQLRFVASDEGDGSIVEAGVDDFVLTGVMGTSAQEDPARGMRIQLAQNRPNPFGQGTTVRFQVPSREFVSLGIYDVDGRLLRSLTAGEFPAGDHTVRWNGRDALGRPVASGMYYCKMKTGSGTELSRQLVLMR